MLRGTEVLKSKLQNMTCIGKISFLLILRQELGKHKTYFMENYSIVKNLKAFIASLTALNLILHYAKTKPSKTKTKIINKDLTRDFEYIQKQGGDKEVSFTELSP